VSTTDPTHATFVTPHNCHKNYHRHYHHHCHYRVPPPSVEALMLTAVVATHTVISVPKQYFHFPHHHHHHHHRHATRRPSLFNAMRRHCLWVTGALHARAAKMLSSSSIGRPKR
jgi:hypothetical protein